MGKEIFKYTIVVVLAFGLIRIYDFVTKKPVPIANTVDPRILKLDSQISVLSSKMEIEAKRRDTLYARFNSRFDSINLSHKKNAIDKKKLHNTPDSLLQHRADSIARANGIN